MAPYQTGYNCPVRNCPEPGFLIPGHCIPSCSPELSPVYYSSPSKPPGDTFHIELPSPGDELFVPPVGSVIGSTRTGRAVSASTFNRPRSVRGSRALGRWSPGARVVQIKHRRYNAGSMPGDARNEKNHVTLEGSRAGKGEPYISVSNHKCMMGDPAVSCPPGPRGEAENRSELTSCTSLDHVSASSTRFAMPSNKPSLRVGQERLLTYIPLEHLFGVSKKQETSARET